MIAMQQQRSLSAVGLDNHGLYQPRRCSFSAKETRSKISSWLKNPFKRRASAVRTAESLYVLNDLRERMSSFKNPSEFEPKYPSTGASSDYSSQSDLSSPNHTPKVRRTRRKRTPTLSSKRHVRQVSDISIEVPQDMGKSKSTKIAIFGAEGVGKSAFSVRYLTRRFIGEYIPETESVYDHSANVAGKNVDITLWESMIPTELQNSMKLYESEKQQMKRHSLSSNSSVDSTPSECPRKSTKKYKKSLATCPEEIHTCEEVTKIDKRVNWADGLIVLYDVCDPQSYQEAKELIQYIRCREMCGWKSRDSGIYSSSSSTSSLPRSYKTKPVQIVLAGNKIDLGYRRKVDSSAAEAFAAELNCEFKELSVSESFSETSNIITNVIKVVKKLK